MNTGMHSKGNPLWIRLYRDRYDKEFQKKLSEMLSIDKLIESSGVAHSCGLHSKQDKRITIKFSGLSSLSLLGGAENHYRNETGTARAFKELLMNTDQLDEKGYKLDIEFLLSYPYSDFNYNLILSESTRQDGFSVECLRLDKKYAPDFYTPKKITYGDMSAANTFSNLVSSLKRLQDYIISANKKSAENNKTAFNSKDSNHRIVIKFSVINIMTCFLKINNEIFIDPYTYSKDKYNNEILNLSSPVVNIELDVKTKWDEALKGSTEECSNSYELHRDHFLSLIGHFRYLWHHPLSITSHDATLVTRGVAETLGTFKPPMEVNFEGKAKAIKDYLEKEKKEIPTDSQIDLWKQYMKNEFLRHCSKFVHVDSKEIETTSREPIKLTKIPVFIVGAWKKGDLNNYMKLVKDFFDDPFVSSSLFSQEVIKEFNLGRFIEKYLELSENTDIQDKTEYEKRRQIKELFNRLIYQLSEITALHKDQSDTFFKTIASAILKIVSRDNHESDIESFLIFEELSKTFDEEISVHIAKILDSKVLQTPRATTNDDIIIITDALKKFYKSFDERAGQSPDLTTDGGLGFKPVLIDTDDTEEIRQTIYRNMNQSQLGFVIQTNDILDFPFQEKISDDIRKIIGESKGALLPEETVSGIINSVEELLKKEYYSKPNVYLEKGYLMGRLGKRKDRTGREIEAVCVFKESMSHTESDNITFTHTSFSNYREFKVELYRALKWVWNITEINSAYCLEILEIFRKIIYFKDICQDLYNLAESIPSVKRNATFNKFKGLLLTEEDQKVNYQRHNYKISSFINEITSLEERFLDRYKHNFEFYYKS